MSARLRLTRPDGRVYLDRWGVEWKRLGGIFVHRMDAPDPGLDLHDHPWWFASFVVTGGYEEERAEKSWACHAAYNAEKFGTEPRGNPVVRRRWSMRRMRLSECHRITALRRGRCWTIVLHGPNRRGWGFYLPDGWMAWQTYDQTIRAERRDLHVEISSNDPEGSRP